MLPGYLFFGDWTFDTPRIDTRVRRPSRLATGTPGQNWAVDASNYHRCTQLSQPYDPDDAQYLWWQGYDLVMPGGLTQTVMVAAPGLPMPTMTVGGSAVTFVGTTKNGWRIGCLPATSNGEVGEAFLVVDPEGTKYFLDYLVGKNVGNITENDGGVIIYHPIMHAAMMVRRIEDRFGNSLTFSYSGVKLTSVTASDGRTVTINWRTDADLVASIVVQSGSPTQQTTSYEYTSGRLTGVVLPDQSRWTFNNLVSNFSPAITPGCSTRNINPASQGTGLVSTVTHPSGLVGRFTTKATYHGRSYVPSFCDTYPEAHESISPVFSTGSLTAKEISGPGVPTRTWNYTYSPVTASTTRDSCAASNTCVDYKSVTEVAPDGVQTIYLFSNRFDESEGNDLSLLTYAAGSSTALRTITKSYASPSAGPYPASIGGSMLPGDYNYKREQSIAPLKSITTTQESTTFNWNVATGCGGYPYCFDSFGRPTQVNKVGTDSKTESTLYHDDLPRWVVGQIERQTTNGIETNRVEFDPNAQPWKQYSFGRLEATYTYLSSGLLSTATDGISRPISLEDYYRGIPRLVRFADGTTRLATVNDNGWVTSITDERSAKTCYGYDSMGRVNLITYPSEGPSGVCDATTWTVTSVTFTPLTVSELNVPVGTWRQRSTQGRMQKSIYHDAFWRPVLVEEKDTTTGAAIYTRKSYDQDGRVVLDSYPLSNSSAMDGINNFYDAVGRLTQRRTSDGVITLETIAYLSGNRLQVTDADNRVSTTTYQAFDQPDYSNTLRVDAPENTTAITTRDVFGKVLNITQSGSWSGGFASATRTFEYDSFQRPCRRTDPERGSTVWGYDAASQRVWEAKGQSASGCLSAAPPDATIFGYDLRGRKTLDDYPSTTADVSYGYDPAGNATSVTNPTAAWTYTYNKRNLLETEQVIIDGKTRLFDPAYNALGQLMSLTTPANTISYSPDAWGRPTQLSSYVTNIQYHPNAVPSSYSLGNGLAYTQTLDTYLRVQMQDTRDGSTSIQKFWYGYNNSGQVVSLDDQVDNTNDLAATYDGLHRLATASGLWGRYGYTYDTLNNIRARSGSNALTYSYDANNRLSTVTGGQSRTYGYNTRGAITSDGNKNFTVNVSDQISAITGVAAYSYDGNYKRIKTNKPAGIEYTLYSHAGAMTFVEKDAEMTDELALNGQILVELKKTGGVTTPTYLHPDLLGSPRAATNPNRVVLWYETYDPYGVKLNGAPDKVGYTGHAYDQESDFTYMQARFYDARVGRFLSTDPVDDGFNLYAYVGNDPLNKTDPSGLCDDPWCLGQADARVREIHQSDPAFAAKADKAMASVAVATVAVASCVAGCEGALLWAVGNPATVSTLSVAAAEVAAGPGIGPGTSLVSVATQEANAAKAMTGVEKALIREIKDLPSDARLTTGQIRALDKNLDAVLESLSGSVRNGNQRAINNTLDLLTGARDSGGARFRPEFVNQIPGAQQKISEYLRNLGL